MGNIIREPNIRLLGTQGNYYLIEVRFPVKSGVTREGKDLYTPHDRAITLMIDPEELWQVPKDAAVPYQRFEGPVVGDSTYKDICNMQEGLDNELEKEKIIEEPGSVVSRESQGQDLPSGGSEGERSSRRRYGFEFL